MVTNEKLEKSSYFATFIEAPLRLECGFELEDCTIAYRTYGKLNKNRDNAVLICHALTGDQFVAENHPITGKEGWWEIIVGPNKVIDTNKFYVICSNILGGCSGSTGPVSINPRTGKRWGLDFPPITIRDMVSAQERLIQRLGVSKLFCVIGGSMGGMQVLQWISSAPYKVKCAIAIATCGKHSAQNIAFSLVGRQAIYNDPDWQEGNYIKQPVRGLSLARMIAHITYHSNDLLQDKYGRMKGLKNIIRKTFNNRNSWLWYDKETRIELLKESSNYMVESFLKYQGVDFTERFDANSYIYILKAIDNFDLSNGNPALLKNAFSGYKRKPVAIYSFSSDWLYTTNENIEISEALKEAGADVTFKEFQSNNGHDAFLLDEPELHDCMQNFLSMNFS